jgi:hypothetical protein
MPTPPTTAYSPKVPVHGLRTSLLPSVRGRSAEARTMWPVSSNSSRTAARLDPTFVATWTALAPMSIHSSSRLAIMACGTQGSSERYGSLLPPPSRARRIA